MRHADRRDSDTIIRGGGQKKMNIFEQIMVGILSKVI
jgi:hypothetical protein